MDIGHGKMSNGEQASGIGAPAPIARDRTGRLPVGSDGRSILGFATLSHSNLKSWAKIEAAQGHNTRAIETPNARKDAPPPIELLEEKSGTYVARVKEVLRQHGAPGKPVKTRKNGTIANEDVYGASPEYWNRAGPWRLKSVEEIKSDPVVRAAVAFARRKHGSRLVSCSLHLDEESPHIHVISVPLVERAHAKRGRKPKGTPRDEKGKPLEDFRPKVTKWSLDVSSIRGRSSDLEKNHDEWAEICKAFGLVRGAKGSEMSQEQRRARRNRQTGRSSHAEKEAREDRESLHEAAQRAVERAAEQEKLAEERERRAEAREKEAEKKAEEAAADRVAAKEAREAAEAAAARADAREVENERVRGELAMKKEKLDEQAAAVAREAAERQDQIRFISKALDPHSSFELSYRDGRIEAEGTLDDCDTLASRGSWDWLKDGLERFVERLTDLRRREANASDLLRSAEAKMEAASGAQEKQTAALVALRLEQGRQRLRMGIFEKAVTPNGGIDVTDVGGKIVLTNLTDIETVALEEGPEWYRSALRRVARGLSDIAAQGVRLGRELGLLEKREGDVSARERAAIALDAALEAKRSDLEQRVSNLESWYQREQAKLASARSKATAFMDAWHALPEEERSPLINQALSKAEGLTLDDLPPGFSVPSQGGRVR